MERRSWYSCMDYLLGSHSPPSEALKQVLLNSDGIPPSQCNFSAGHITPCHSSGCRTLLLSVLHPILCFSEFQDISILPSAGMSRLKTEDVELGTLGGNTKNPPPPYRSQGDSNPKAASTNESTEREDEHPDTADKNTNQSAGIYAPEVPYILNLVLGIISFFGTVFAISAHMVYERYSYWTYEVQVWPESLDTTDLKCQMALSITSFLQATLLSHFILERPTASFIVFSIFTTAYSVCIPFLYSIDIFKTGAYSSDPAIRSTLKDWSCKMKKQPASDLIRFDGICSDLVRYYCPLLPYY